MHANRSNSNKRHTFIETPSVSVILPVFNGAKHLNMAVRSILAQSFKELELIVVDDASTDATPRILQTLNDPRLVVVRHDFNSGYPTAMNTGIDRARGEFIARMDADDVSAPDRLIKQVEFLRAHEEMALVGTCFRALSPRGMFCPDTQKAKAGWIEEDWESVRQGRRRFADPSVVCRKRDVQAVGGYRTYQRSGQDVDLWLRLLERKPRAASLEEALYFRRLRVAMMSLDPGAAARNKVPRVLADQRKQSGSDAVMRGEPLPVLTGDAITKSKHWQAVGFWDAAEKCWSAGDLRSGWNFAVRGLLSSGLSRVSVARSLQFVRLLMRPRTRIEKVLAP